MTIICPKCSHVRKADDTAPDWQCPACKICYAKYSGNSGVNPPPARRAERESAVSSVDVSAIPWVKLLLLAAIGWGAWTAIKSPRATSHTVPAVIENASALTPDQMALVARTVQPGDVVMYTTSECVYCAQAKGWLRQNKFEFKECNMSVNDDCIREYKNYGADGTPFLIVRGYQMKNGFDSDEFITVLKRTPSASI